MLIVPYQKQRKFTIFIKLMNASVKDISETKLDRSVLSNEVAIEDYVLINVDRSRKGGGVARFITLLLTVFKPICVLTRRHFHRDIST